MLRDFTPTPGLMLMNLVTAALGVMSLGEHQVIGIVLIMLGTFLFLLNSAILVGRWLNDKEAADGRQG